MRVSGAGHIYPETVIANAMLQPSPETFSPKLATSGKPSSGGSHEEVTVFFGHQIIAILKSVEAGRTAKDSSFEVR